MLRPIVVQESAGTAGKRKVLAEVLMAPSVGFFFSLEII
jgi:hypothetical protein